MLHYGYYGKMILTTTYLFIRLVFSILIKACMFNGAALLIIPISNIIYQFAAKTQQIHWKQNEIYERIPIHLAISI